MSNSVGGQSYDPEAYRNALRDLRDTLGTVEVVGWPRRDADLAELERRVGKYPDEARKLLDRTESTGP